MSKFFVNRPIVAIVISIIIVIVGIVSLLGLPVAQFPSIVPPEIQISTTYVGADALTVEQAVATPIEQQMSGVDNMIYMYSINANSGTMTLRVDFDVSTDPNTDQILSQMRQSQAASQLPAAVTNYGVTVQKSLSSPLIMYALYSPKGTYDSRFLANYAYININDAMTRVPGIASVTVFGSGQYAMRIWVRPDTLARLNLTVTEIIDAVKAQNTVNPAGQIGGEPVPPGQEFTYAAIAQGRLETEEEFGEIVVRAESNGAIVRLKDVARIDLGSQNYLNTGRLNGKPCALLALYQLPGSNAVDAAEKSRIMMEQLKERFPADIDYKVSLDTTEAVKDSMVEIEHTLAEALLLVIIVVFIFLQGWRATLIPLIAVPVSLIGTFIFFPMMGFSINTLSLFGLVLAIGLVVDDAIVVVEAVEHYIEKGFAPKEATLKAMHDVQGPVIAIAIILSAVFVPTIFLPGITGRLYQQFAVTIAVSVLISAFNALTLSPALAAMLLKPKKESRGPLAWCFKKFNIGFGHATNGYIAVCRSMIRKTAFSLIALVLIVLGIGGIGKHIPGGFLPEEDQGYMFVNVALPDASSFQRNDEIAKQVEAVLAKTPGVKYYATVVGYSLLSSVATTYNSFFFVTLEPWGDRKTPELSFPAITKRLNAELSKIPGAAAFSFPPPAIPGVGSSGGITMVLQDRTGSDVAYLAKNTQDFMAAARKRPELGGLFTTFIPTVPQKFVNVNRDKAVKQEMPLNQIYTTIQAFMGGTFVNYFNRFGRQWQVYVQAEGEFRNKAENVGQFYVRNKAGDAVPLSTVTSIDERSGPEFTMRFNLYRSAQINAFPAEGYTGGQATKALEEVFAETMPSGMGFDYSGMSKQAQEAAAGVPPAAVFGLSILFVFLILAAQYESWTLPFSVLLGTPIAVFGAFLALFLRGMEMNIYAQIGLVMLIGLAAKNAILIVEFAKVEYEKGRTLLDATLEGARVRLRPILMTAFAFILGCVPLWRASGSGAISRQVLGTAVIGGMLAATLVSIFFIPLLFHVVEKISGEKNHAPVEPTPEPPAPPAAESNPASMA